MNVNDFIEEYKTSGDKERCVKKHIVNSYISYRDKIADATKIVDISSHVKREDGSEKFLLNSPIRYMLFMMAVINRYTDINFDSSNGLLEFDLLESNGVTDLLPSLIGSDYLRFKTVVNMAFDDIVENERSIVAFLENKIETINAILSSMEAEDGGDN